MLVFRTIVECETPLHCGCGKDDFLQDQPVARDAFGNWYIPGSSIAGCLRTWAECGDNGVAAKLFGSLENSKGRQASLFWSRDGLLLDFDGETALAKSMRNEPPAIAQGPYVRDHVRLGLDSGVAEETAKFDEEIVPAGARFALELAFDQWGREDVGEELALFLKICAHVAAGRAMFGGKAGSGLGLVRVLKASCREFDLADASGMEQWLNLSDGPMFRTGEGREVALPPACGLENAGGEGLSGEISLDFAAEGPVIVAGGSQAPQDDGTEAPDMAFATSPRISYESKRTERVYAVPGSSLRGAVRHAVYAVCLAKGMPKAKAEDVVRELFGHAEGDAGRPGKLSFFDAPLQGAGSARFINHVALDRFTGGALDGALFNEGPVWKAGMRLGFKVGMTNLDGGEAALLFHALLDLAEGGLPVGGGASRGNGRLRLENPAKAVAEASASLFWNGERLSSLAGVAKVWDESLQRMVAE